MNTKNLLRAALTAGLCAVLGSTTASAQRPAARTQAAPTRTYRSPTLVGDAIVQIDPETRSLIVITDDATNEQIRQVIDTLDQPKPQVLIKVLFMEITHRDALDVGLEAEYALTIPEVTQAGLRTAWGVTQELQGGFWHLMTDDFQTTLRAMAERGKLEVLSRPSILARNNQEAVILVGEEFPYVTSSRVTDAGAVINTIQYAEVGIMLRVTPFITSDNLVEMIISPEISTLTERTVQISDTVRAPVIAKRSAETVVVTPHGKTVVIGGLMETRKTESQSRVPLLGSLPLLGMAFRRTVSEDVKKELVIFLTPYIVASPGDLETVSRETLGQSRWKPAPRPPDNDRGLLLEEVPW